MAGQDYQEIQIRSTYSEARSVEDRIVEIAQGSGYDEESLFALRLSLEEALANAIHHGNVGDSSKKVCIRYHVSRDRIEIFVTDEGVGFDPGGVPDPTTATNLERACGRGIMLMRAYMNLVEYNQAGNAVHLVKFNKAG